MRNESKENFIALIIAISVLGILGMVMCFYNLTIGIIQVSIAIFLVLVSAFAIWKNHGQLSEYIESLRFRVDDLKHDGLGTSPVPVVVFMPSGKILWTNSKFDNLFGNAGLFDKPFETVFPSINKNILLNDVPEFSCYIDSKHYHVTGKRLFEDKKKSTLSHIALYLFEDTENYEYSLKYLEEKPIIGVINIDNYDDVLLNTPDAYRSLLLAEIDNKINNWFAFTEGVLKKVEKDRYFLFFPHNCLNKMIEDKFSILDDVRSIRCGNKFSATLSIGIGNGDKDFKELDDAANSAITLALGRGGDQAVIKENNDVKFFGGKTREHEKTTKVKARVTANTLKDLFANSSNVLIMGHKLPDMDAIGAAIGISAFARFYDKDVRIIYENTSPSVNGIIKRLEEKSEHYKETFISPEHALDFVQGNTLLVVADVHKPDYTEYPPLIEKVNNIVVIDHHRRGEDFIDGAKLVYHEPYASSTCELVAEILQYTGGDFTLEPSEAEAVYAGIMQDTKDFAMKTGVRTFEAAAFLKRCGVDIVEVRKFFRNDFNSFVSIAQIASSAITVNGNIAISTCEQTDEKDYTIAPQAADRLLSISGIEASFVLMAKSDEISISGRSSGNINTQLIMEKLGGGGHLTMAGAQLKDCTLEEAKERLIKAINEYNEENE